MTFEQVRVFKTVIAYHDAFAWFLFGAYHLEDVVHGPDGYDREARPVLSLYVCMYVGMYVYVMMYVCMQIYGREARPVFSLYVCMYVGSFHVCVCVYACA